MNGPFSNVDIGSAEVHITEVVIKGLPKGDIHITEKALFIQTFILVDKILMVAFRAVSLMEIQVPTPKII